MLFKERVYNMDDLKLLNNEISLVPPKSKHEEIEALMQKIKNESKKRSIKEDDQKILTHMEIFTILSFIKEKKQEIGRVEARIINKLEVILKGMENHNISNLEQRLKDGEA